MWPQVHCCLICPEFKNVHGAITSPTEAGDNIERRSTEKPGEDTLKAQREIARRDEQTPRPYTNKLLCLLKMCIIKYSTFYILCQEKNRYLTNCPPNSLRLVCKIKAYWFHLSPQIQKLHADFRLKISTKDPNFKMQFMYA